MGIDVQLRKENEEILGQLGDSGALARAAGCGVLQDTHFSEKFPAKRSRKNGKKLLQRAVRSARSMATLQRR
jgi:hypothetical protein